MEQILLKENNFEAEGVYKLPTREEVERGMRIPLISDTMFKTMINNESRKEYASYIIANVLGKDFNSIYKTIKIMKSRLDKDNYHMQGKEVDFVCVIDNEVVGIEMNNTPSVASLERNISYAAELYKSKLEKGGAYDYRKVIQININNFRFKDDEEEIERFMLMSNKGNILTDKIQIINISLYIIKNKCYTKDKLSAIEKFLIICNEQNKDLVNKLKEGDDILERYVKESQDASISNDIIGLYDKELHMEKLRLSEKEEARHAGIEEGMEKGLEKGIKKGHQEATKETAKKMLSNNLDIKLISECTGLTLEEIEKLK